jgi:predicted Kef-type K+ transport protein
MLPIWIAAAFALGLLARQLGLPPLVGFLGAGFLLNAAGVERIPGLSDIAHIGVLLLLFSVGLKLRIQHLVRTEVWGVALLQFAVAVGVVMLAWQAGGGPSLPVILVLAGTLSFSSTVLAAKILEERREIRGFHGRVAIGILIVQDIIAIAILGVNADHALTWTASLALFLPVAQPLLRKLLDMAGHGELLVLLGGVLAIGLGGYGFEAIGLSGELGALLIGMLLSNHPRAVELSASLWSLKELFLVGFFLSIGLTGLPTLHTLGLAALPLAILPLKTLLYYFLLLAFGLSARTGFLAGLSLATYSEFGLIVMAGAVESELVPAEWLVATAIAVAISFAIGAPINRYAHDIYAALEPFLRFFERNRRHPDDEPVSLGSAEVIVVGMGRVGTGAYNHTKESGGKVVGLDSDMAKVQRHLHEGRRVVYADAEDPLLWHRLRLDRVKVIMLAVPDLQAKVVASEQLRRRGYTSLISATYVWPEERQQILDAGADVTYNYFAEAGVGLATDTFNALAPGGDSRPNRRPRKPAAVEPTAP